MINDSYDGALMTLIFLFGAFGEIPFFLCLFIYKHFQKVLSLMTSKAKHFSSWKVAASSVFWATYSSLFLHNKLRSLYSSVCFTSPTTKNCLSRTNKQTNKSGNLRCPLNQPKISVFNLNNIINYCYANQLLTAKWVIDSCPRTRLFRFP